MQPDNPLNGKILSPLVDFNVIVNTDMGLIRFIRENFQDPRAFDLDKLNRSDREILSLLYSREEANPLSIISTEENMKDIDSLYFSFFSSYQKEIISRSISESSILSFVRMMFESGTNMGISPFICVENDIEKDEISSHFDKSNLVFKNDKKAILNKDVYYIKDYRFFTSIGLDECITHKKIYMLPTKYNKNYFEKVDSIFTNTNEFVLIGKDFSKEENNDGE